ncbi:MAG TPA: CBS domain-containing protein [Candidatus Aquicultor sp.]|jgi:CBS domain-containing protein
MAQLKLRARDIMSKEIVVFTPDMTVKEAAGILSAKGISGAPVVDNEDRLVGMVSESDLIMQDVRLHFPTFIQLLDGYIYLPSSMQRFEEEFKKAVGAKVGDVMSTEVVTIGEDDTVEDIATLMVEQDISRAPVMSDGKLVGIITKGDLVRAISKQ